MQTTIAVLVAILVLVGIVGAVVPGIPGTPLILAGALIYAFANDWHPIGVGRLLILASLTIVAELSGYLAVAVGAKRSGGSRWAVIGAIAGVIVGIGFAPLGLVLGPLAGAIAGEALYTRNLRGSVRPGIGAAVGVLAGAITQFALALVMVALFGWWIWRG